jgi:hypothetical protein
VKLSFRTYGLTIDSDLPLPGLQALADPPPESDLVLCLAAFPSWAQELLKNQPVARRIRPPAVLPGESFTVWEYADESFFQLIYGDGTRFVIDGRAARVWGEPGPGLTHEDLCVYLLGPVMGFIARRRGFTPLHASSVIIGKRAIALMGEAGSGKSTTAAALALRGWPTLCEDVCILTETNLQLHVIPGYPRICLWPDSVSYLFSSPDALPAIVRGWEKRFLALDGRTRARAALSSCPLSSILFLAPRSDDNRAPSIEPLPKRRAVLQLVQNSYMNWLLNRQQRASEFDIIVKLVSQVDCFRLTPSSDPARLDELVSLIESHVLHASIPATSMAGAMENV